MKIAGVILSGGKNKRMGGRDKAFLTINGKTIIERILSVLKNIFDEILIVTNNPDKYKKFKIRTIKDKINNAGPLGGIYAGLKTIKSRAAFFIACDMPFLHNEIIRKEIEFFKKEKPDCLIAGCGNDIHPLHSIYKKSLAALSLETIKSGNFSLRSFIRQCPDVKFIGFPKRYSRYFTNINTEKDQRRLKC